MFDTVNPPASGFQVFGVFRRNRLLFCLTAIQVLAGIAVTSYAGLPFWSEVSHRLFGAARVLITFMLANFFLWRFSVAVFVAKPARPIHWMIADARSIFSNRTHISDAIACYLNIVALIVVFSILKEAIPSVNFYSWDPTFAKLDRFLHGGNDPWTLLWPILNSPYVVTVINISYHVWFVLIYMAVCLACIDRRDPNRSIIFLLAFSLCWSVGGNLLATIFASVGPVYYEAFGFGDTFVPLVEQLHRSNEISPVWALEWHQLLLDGHFNDGPVVGISAMPSMHVATSVLMAIYGFTYSRWLGWSMTVFAAVIMVGSVLLAWHYAIDGYASCFLAFLFWWVAKKLTARFGPFT